jgi:hypothetical protein
MTYWVYENWRAENKAVIHHASCGYCNDGRGCHDNPCGNRNGKWHRPFSTYEEAEKTAKNTGRLVKNCPNGKCP